jgi:hypothetical protein
LERSRRGSPRWLRRLVSNKVSFCLSGEKEKKGKRFRRKTRVIYGLVGRRGPTADCCKASEWPPWSSTTWGVKRRESSRGVEPQRVPGNPGVLNHTRLLLPGWSPHSCLVCSTGGGTRDSLLVTLLDKTNHQHCTYQNPRRLRSPGWTPGFRSRAGPAGPAPQTS